MTGMFRFEPAPPHAEHEIITLAKVYRHFGAVTALAEADLTIRAGRMISILGHNGAGKSTLIKILAGTLLPSAGRILISDEDVSAHYSMRLAYQRGIRCVFQELSLCPNLRVFENTRVLHGDLRGLGWRKRAKSLIAGALDLIFPGHGIDVNSLVSDLTLSQRQMVEIARAFTVTATPVRVIILDEPTSSLDPSAAQQLLMFTRKVRQYGIACIFISHKLREIVEYSDDIVIMRDGRISALEASQGLSEADLLDRMGMVAAGVLESIPPPKRRDDGQKCVELVSTRNSEMPFYARPGEVVGLAGLAGQGQRELLLRILSGSRGKDRQMQVTGRAVYVAGDRQNEGLFPLWSVGENLTIGLLDKLSRGGMIDLAAERRVATTWREKLNIRVPSIDDVITGLSGGNQQKVLVARALACEPEVILLDDPLRGVDVHTKNELYREVRGRLSSGCSFVWFTTENAELAICDRIYVFKDGAITDCFAQHEYSEDRLIRASFHEGGVDVR